MIEKENNNHLPVTNDTKNENFWKKIKKYSTFCYSN